MLKTQGVFSLNNRIKAVVLLFFCAAVFLFSGVFPLLAQSPDLGTGYVEPLGLPDKDPRVAAVELVRLLITFVGIIAVIFVLYAGFLWMTSAGNEEKVSRAKKTLVNAVIGLVLILAAFLIVSFVINRLGGDPLSGPGGPGGGTPGAIRGGLGASGNRIIEAHYPERNQRNVSRDTSIVITFREPMLIDDLISRDGENYIINEANLKIYKKGSDLLEANFLATSSIDQKTFVFRQRPPYLGSPSENIEYIVELGEEIRKANTDYAWPVGLSERGYAWLFETGTMIDNTPPRVISIIPRPESEEPRNVVIQLNFSKAIDPLSASGHTSAFSNITVSTGTPIRGNFYISNGYRTVEFLTEEECGVNSCNQIVYCLPGEENISVLAKAATLVLAGQPKALLADGIIDMSNNSLDGNKDGSAQGPQVPAGGGVGSGQPPYNENSPDPAAQGDDYTWFFDTNNQIIITAPVIEIINMDFSETSVADNFSPAATFNRIIMCTNLEKERSYELLSNGVIPFYEARCSNNDGKTTVRFSHGGFEPGASYSPQYYSGIMDIYQNCFNPAAGPNNDGSGICEPDVDDPFCCDGFLQAAPCSP